MNWKVLRVNTWWTAEEASTVLTFIDELRDELLATHGDQIKAMHLAQIEGQKADENQGQLNLDNHIDF